MIGSPHPSILTPGERLAEIGSLLAAGYRRLRSSSQKPLDSCPEPERPCDSVNNSESKRTQEVA